MNTNSINTKKIIIKTIMVVVLVVLLLAIFVYATKSEKPVQQEEQKQEEVTAVKNDLIEVTSPLPNSVVAKTFTITGRARGQWYFEASFPVYLTDWDGKIIAQGIATAQGDWMTTEFVPFTATLTYSPADISGQYSKRGTLILQKDNPSGLPEHDAAIEIPVTLE